MASTEKSSNLPWVPLLKAVDPAASDSSTETVASLWIKSTHLLSAGTLLNKHTWTDTFHVTFKLHSLKLWEEIAHKLTEKAVACEMDAGVVIMLSPSLRPAHLANGIGCSHCIAWGQSTHTHMHAAEKKDGWRMRRWRCDGSHQLTCLVEKPSAWKHWRGGGGRTIKRRTWSIDVYKDGECISPLMAVEGWGGHGGARNRWINPVVKSNLKSLRMNKEERRNEMVRRRIGS